MTADAELDHIVLGCLSLEDARPKLEAALGVPAQGGGAHEGRGTHNALWGLAAGGPAYLELIAPDPAQDLPEDAPRPFGLHLPETRARLAERPRLLTWVARCRDLDARAARSPLPLGEAVEMRRGELSWRLTFPEGNRPLREGVVPSLIEWPEDATPPGAALAGSGLRLARFLRRPDAHAAEALAALGLAELLPEGETGGTPLRAEIEGPGGVAALD